MRFRLLCRWCLVFAGPLLSLGCGDQARPVAAQSQTEPIGPGRTISIGADLFKIKAIKNEAEVATPTHLGVEPILVPAHLTIMEQGQVSLPALRDGRILFIGTEIKPGDPPSPIVFKHRGKSYRPLEAGDRVEPGDTVMLLDDSEAFAKLEAARVAEEALGKVLAQARFVKEKVEVVHTIRTNLYNKNNLSELEYVQSAAEVARALATESSQQAEYEAKRQEHIAAKINYEYYTIRANMAGIVQPFSHRPGQSVKALEPVLQIQNTDYLRADGMVALGYVGRLRRGMPVFIEPLIEEAPRVRRRFHTQAINAIAVSSHEPRPYIVTASEDRTARVWDGLSDRETAIFAHSVAVRSVACSPPSGTKKYCLTGCEDGKGRLWDLTNPKSSNIPLRELDGGHRGAISAVAFAPDGKTCATADARDICIWDVESGQLRYKLPQHHLGEITSLAYTPQAKLVSAGRDMTVRVWSLGTEGARLDYTQEGRSGDMSRLGVSHDGQYFLFDVGPSLRLMNLVDRRNVGVIESVHEASKLSTFAVFSHDSRLVLTGSQNEGRLSVWRTPIGGFRATELRQFVPRERMVVFTCAAVSPFGNDPFAVTGTKSGDLYVWPMPTERELERIPGVLKFIDQTAAAATHAVRIWADFPNPKERPLTVGTQVTIVIEPNVGREIAK
jgi:WD40 repeat protein